MLSRSRLANVLVAIVVGTIFLTGLFVHGAVGGVLLLAVAALLGYLSSQAWSAIHPRARGLRLIVLAVIVVVAIVKIATS